MIEIEYSFIRRMTLGFWREWWVWSGIQKDNVEYVIGNTWDKCLYSPDTIFVLEISYSPYELKDFRPMDWLGFTGSRGRIYLNEDFNIWFWESVVHMER